MSDRDYRPSGLINAPGDDRRPLLLAGDNAMLALANISRHPDTTRSNVRQWRQELLDIFDQVLLEKATQQARTHTNEAAE